MNLNFQLQTATRLAVGLACLAMCYRSLAFCIPWFIRAWALPQKLWAVKWKFQSFHDVQEISCTRFGFEVELYSKCRRCSCFVGRISARSLSSMEFFELKSGTESWRKCVSPDTGQNLLCWQVLERDFLLTYYHCLKTVVLNVQASRFCLLLPHLEQFITSRLSIDKNNKWTITILLLSCQFTFVHRNTSPLENLTINACNVAHLPS